MIWRGEWIFVAAIFMISSSQPALAKGAKDLQSVPVPVPNGKQGIGFDDLIFASGLDKVLVPGGRTGTLYLIDPSTYGIETIKGFSAQEGYYGGHGQSVTSADEGEGLIFIADRDTQRLYAVDPKTGAGLASALLAGKPDYVRFMKDCREVWVTQPSSEQIEVFKFSAGKPTLTHLMFIEVPGGPESLIEDQARQRAYTHLWEGKTAVIDVHTHRIIGQWPNGCEGSRGIALDERQGFLFAGCAEGKAVVLDLNRNGQIRSHLSTGAGVDVIGYNASLRHLYLSGEISATLSVIGVSNEGQLSLLGTGRAASGAHCVTGDDQKNIWVCDPYHGRLLRYKDPFPAV